MLVCALPNHFKTYQRTPKNGCPIQDTLATLAGTHSPAAQAEGRPYNRHGSFFDAIL